VACSRMVHELQTPDGVMTISCLAVALAILTAARRGRL